MLGESLRRRRKLDTRRAGKSHAPPIRWSRWLLAVAIAVPLCFGTGYVLAIGVLFPVPEEVGGDTVPVPDLGRTTFAEAERLLAEAGLAVGEVSRYPHPSVPEGQVVAQSPVPGQHLRPGAEVRLGVSAGPVSVLVPNLIGLPAAEAAALASRLGFAVEQLDRPDAGPSGMVLSVDPAPGTERRLPAPLRITVSVPLPVIPVDTMPFGEDVPFQRPAPGVWPEPSAPGF